MDLKTANKNRWDACHISQDQGPAFKKVADVLMQLNNHNRYQAVSDELSKRGYVVPWWFIAVVHYREAGFVNGQPNWNAYLGNGQPLNRKTTLVPVGRGPFKSWEEGAVDALVYAPPYAIKNYDWSIGGALTEIEEFNGLGYANKDLPSPYLWAGTDQYTAGKYVADGKFSPVTVDTQLGCAGLLKFMGVFKTAPTGLGTVAGAVTVAGAAATAAHSQTDWMWFHEHWLALFIGALGIGFVVDLALAIYNNEKNQLKVKPNVKIN